MSKAGATRQGRGLVGLPRSTWLHGKDERPGSLGTNRGWEPRLRLGWGLGTGSCGSCPEGKPELAGVTPGGAGKGAEVFGNLLGQWNETVVGGS